MSTNNTNRIASVRIILKNGGEFIVKCKKFSVKENAHGELTGYTIEGIEENSPLYLRFSEVAAIVHVLSDNIGEENIGFDDFK